VADTCPSSSGFLFPRLRDALLFPTFTATVISPFGFLRKFPNRDKLASGLFFFLSLPVLIRNTSFRKVLFSPSGWAFLRRDFIVVRLNGSIPPRVSPPQFSDVNFPRYAPLSVAGAGRLVRRFSPVLTLPFQPLFFQASFFRGKSSRQDRRRPPFALSVSTACAPCAVLFCVSIPSVKVDVCSSTS